MDIDDHNMVHGYWLWLVLRVIHPVYITGWII